MPPALEGAVVVVVLAADERPEAPANWLVADPAAAALDDPPPQPASRAAVQRTGAAYSRNVPDLSIAGPPSVVVLLTDSVHRPRVTPR